ncbi:hypothetical protein HYV70_02375 [Candidatus Uhrbacteria bacterium]|nr:hypothetical protein [Candidatus Uhrbacteria bacterium]
MKKTPHILFGISGIGYGHTFRQLPLVEHFAACGRVTIFAHGQSEEFYRKQFRHRASVHVERIEIPFLTGSKTGLDFWKAAKEPINQSSTYLRTNLMAMKRAEEFIGKPNLVITDYEPLSAQYAYLYQSPLVTIDQQSKYLIGQFPKILHGLSYQDEVARLHMFFPYAAKRIACSFFHVTRSPQAVDDVEIFPSIIKQKVRELARSKSLNPSLLVYISAARKFIQSQKETVQALQSIKKTDLHLFVQASEVTFFRQQRQSNWHIHPHGDKQFLPLLARCHGMIATAGHSLLSECMYLGIPVYAIAIAPYEQHMNAAVIQKGGFGISAPGLTKHALKNFEKHLPTFEQNIRHDKTILLRGSGQDTIIPILEGMIT